MRHITIRDTLNEYDVEDAFYVIEEHGVHQYVFVVLDKEFNGEDYDVKKYTLVVAITDIVENVCDYDEIAIARLAVQSEIAAKQAFEEYKRNNELTGEHYYG